MRNRPRQSFALALIFSAIALFGENPAAADLPRVADAVRDRDQGALRALVRDRADVNVTQPDGASALHWAVHWDDLETARLLLDAGAKPNVTNDHGITPLALASSNSSTSMVKMLVEAGADVNAPVRQDETPLMLVARTGNLDAVSILLAHHADVNRKEAWNSQTALMWAAAFRHPPVVEALISGGADVNARSASGLTPLMFAVRAGDIDSSRLLLSTGARVNDVRPDGATALLIAVVNGDEDVVDMLLEAGADPNVEGGSIEVSLPGKRAKATPLKFDESPAANAGSTQSAGIVVPPTTTLRGGNLWGTPLHALVYTANPEYSGISWGVKIDKVRVAKALLAHGANPNAQLRSMQPMFAGGRYHTDLAGATPFLFAAKAGDCELMRLLLDHGADFKLTAKNGTTPLMAAAGLAWSPGQERASESDAAAAVRMIVELGADVNARNDLYETALHGAAYRGANSIIQYLVDKGAQVNVEDLHGWTATTVAEGVPYGNAWFEQRQSAELLRSLGGNTERTRTYDHNVGRPTK